MSEWRTRLRASTREAARTAEALLLLGAATSLVRCWPGSASAALVRALIADDGATGREPRVEAAVLRALERAERCVPRTSCLSRAVVAYAMLKRRRVFARVRVGAKRDASGVLRAHAWLECDGARVFGAGSNEDYPAFSRAA